MTTDIKCASCGHAISTQDVQTKKAKQEGEHFFCNDACRKTSLPNIIKRSAYSAVRMETDETVHRSINRKKRR